MTLTLEQIRRRGLAALRRELGKAGTIRFLQQFETGSGDYARTPFLGGSDFARRHSRRGKRQASQEEVTTPRFSVTGGVVDLYDPLAMPRSCQRRTLNSTAPWTSAIAEPSSRETANTPLSQSTDLDSLPGLWTINHNCTALTACELPVRTAVKTHRPNESTQGVPRSADEESCAINLADHSSGPKRRGSRSTSRAVSALGPVRFRRNRMRRRQFGSLPHTASIAERFKHCSSQQLQQKSRSIDTDDGCQNEGNAFWELEMRKHTKEFRDEMGLLIGYRTAFGPGVQGRRVTKPSTAAPSTHSASRGR